MQDRIFRRGKVYYCWYYDSRGRRIKRTTKCTDKRAAFGALAKFERDAQGASHRASDEAPITIEDGVNLLLNMGCSDLSSATISMYTQKGGHLVRLLNHLEMPPAEMDLVKYISTRKEEGAAPETIRKELVTLRRALQQLKMPIDSIPKFKVRYVPRKTYLTHDEFRALIAVLSPHRQLWLVIAVFTGGRDSEIDSLAWEHIDWGQKIVELQGTKTAKSRRPIPLHPVLSAVLAPMRQKSGIIAGEWSNANRDINAACKRAGIEKHITPNDLRRTFASWMKQSGVDSYHVAQLLGHSTSRMVELVYGRIDSSTLRRAMSNLPGGEEWDNCGREPALRDSIQSAESRSLLPGNPQVLVSTVLGDGIEPSTRGFSVRSHPSSSSDNKRVITSGVK